jgi:acetylornithine/succinyldiaminopimelate/putrescine aminotransferase
MGLLKRKASSDVLRNDKKFVGRTSPPRDLEIVAAEGSRVRDARGRTLIDFQMGWCVGNLGWNPPEILARVRDFKGPAYVAPQGTYAPWSELARRLVDITPGDLGRAYRCVGGSEAVELALQLAIVRTGRHKLVSLEEAYHGNTFGARSVGDLGFDAHLAGMKKLAPPLDADALDRLETQLKHRDVAAFIMEPIVMNLGVLVPDDEFMRGLVPLCHRYGTLVIADEVACGLGRTGKLFASEHYELEPDLMCLAKALGSGVAPIATTLATAEIADAVEGDYSFYSTFGWMPIAVEAALGTLDYWDKHGDKLLENIAARSAQLENALREIFEDVEISVKGVAANVKLDDEDRVSRIQKRCTERGLIVIGEEEELMLLPPCTVDEETMDDALEILATAAKR